MPLYEYEITAGETGETLAVVTISVPVAARDKVVLRRRTVPETVNIGGSVPDPRNPARQVLAAYERMERRLGSNAGFRRGIGHHPETIKKAWTAPGS